MSRRKPTDWRQKVNPIFTLAIQFLRAIPRLIRELKQSWPDSGPHIRILLVKACEETMPLLPIALSDQVQATHGLVEQLALQPQNKWLAYPEVRAALVRIEARIGHTPESLLKKGIASPHWWMAQETWAEFIEKEHVSEGLLNALALLQLNVSLHHLTKRVADGDPRLYTRLFRADKKNPNNPDISSERILDSVLQPLKDQGTKIVGRALLRKGEPPGYQLPLRMVLFFGWDFGLCDLSVSELYDFLTQMNLVPNSYDPETLRKYRNRLRKIILEASRSKLPETTQTTTLEA